MGCRLALATALAALPALAAEPDRKHDLPKEIVLYCVDYTHPDTQWRRDFTTTTTRRLWRAAPRGGIPRASGLALP